jgi:hypothetical protein
MCVCERIEKCKACVYRTYIHTHVHATRVPERGAADEEEEAAEEEVAEEEVTGGGVRVSLGVTRCPIELSTVTHVLQRNAPCFITHSVWSSSV